MRRFIEMLATALMTAACIVGFILALIWAMEEPLYGTQPHVKPVPAKPAIYRVMT